MIWRWYWQRAGGHVHVRSFSGPTEGALGKNGDLCFRIDEWRLIKQLLPRHVQLVDETKKEPPAGTGGDE